MSSDNLREQRLKHVTGLATRLARNQINEAEKVFAPVGEADAEMNHVLWETYVAHVAGRLLGVVGAPSAATILRAALANYEKHHDH